MMKLALGKCLACTGGGLGGLLAGHAGCLAVTFWAGFGASAAVAMPRTMPACMLILGAVAGAAGLAFWFRLRGSAASIREKQVVVAGTVLGLILSAALHHPLVEHSPELTFDPLSAFCGKLPA